MSNFWRSLEMPLINCKVELSLDCYAKCIIIIGETDVTFAIRDTKPTSQLVLEKLKTMQDYQNY